jgi:Glycosyl transferase 4-like domain
MEWFPTDSGVEPLVDRVLDAFRPDVAHIHCIQRLTSTLVERVIARHIPYVVTAHDAWWISDHQFLIDGLNALVMPWETEVYETVSNPHTQGTSLRRRRRLARCLRQAALVTTVSRSFAQIYQGGGDWRYSPHSKWPANIAPYRGGAARDRKSPAWPRRRNDISQGFPLFTAYSDPWSVSKPRFVVGGP